VFLKYGALGRVASDIGIRIAPVSVVAVAVAEATAVGFWILSGLVVGPECVSGCVATFLVWKVRVFGWARVVEVLGSTAGSGRTGKTTGAAVTGLELIKVGVMRRGGFLFWSRFWL